MSYFRLRPAQVDSVVTTYGPDGPCVKQAVVLEQAEVAGLGHRAESEPVLMIVSSLRQVPALDRPVGPCRLGREAVDRADDGAVAQVADGGKAPVSGATAPTSRAVRSRRHCGAPIGATPMAPSRPSSTSS